VPALLLPVHALDRITVVANALTSFNMLPPQSLSVSLRQVQHGHISRSSETGTRGLLYARALDRQGR
jgi:hypothetical protein